MNARRPTRKADAARSASGTNAGPATQKTDARRSDPRAPADPGTAGPGTPPPGPADRGTAGPGTPPPGQLVLNSPAHFRALGHPLRHRLLNVLRQRPATLAQLASSLGSTKGTVGYHVQLMIDAGLVRLAGTRRVRGGTERYYEPVGTDLRHDTDAEDRTAFLVQAALDEMLPHRPGDHDVAVLRHVRLTPAQARDVAARIERFATDERLAGAEGPGEPGDADDACDVGDPSGPGYPSDPHGLLFCLYRADIPTLPPDQAG